MAEEFMIVLPPPVRVLSPNCAVATPGGRFAKASAVKRLRKAARDAVEAEQVDGLPWGKALVKSHFFHKERRRRDQDNAMFSLKPVYDGIVDSGLVTDDTPEHMERSIPCLDIDPCFPRVEITIERLA